MGEVALSAGRLSGKTEITKIFMDEYEELRAAELAASKKSWYINPNFKIIPVLVKRVVLRQYK